MAKSMALARLRQLSAGLEGALDAGVPPLGHWRQLGPVHKDEFLSEDKNFNSTNFKIGRLPTARCF